MHGQSELCKVKESYVPIEAANVCNILPEAAVSNGLIVVNLKRYLKYRGHVYFEPVRLHIMYQARTNLKSHCKFYDDIFIAKSFSSEDMFKFSDVAEIQEQSKCVTEKNVSDVKKKSLLHLKIP